MTPLHPYRCHDCDYRGWRVAPLASSRILAGARRSIAAARGRIADAREWTADVVQRRRHAALLALRLVAVAAAVLAVVALLVPAGRWAAARLAGAPHAVGDAASAADAKAHPPAMALPTAPTAKHGPSPATKTASAARTGAPRPTAERRPGARPAAPGWERMRWGMTVREAQAVFPRLRVTRRRGGAGAVATTGAAIGSRAYLAQLRFGRTAGLDEIELRPAADVADADAWFDEALGSLTARFGPPADRRDAASPAGSWSRSVEWTTPGTTVSLRAWKTALLDAHVLRVDVRSGAATPAPTSVEVIYAPARAGPR